MERDTKRYSRTNIGTLPSIKIRNRRCILDQSSGEAILVAKLKSGQQKKEIMLRKGKLKGKKLYIENDLTKKEREVQRELVKLANTEKAQGSQVKTKYRKLWVNDRFFNWGKEGGLVETDFRNRQGSTNLQAEEL